MKRFFLIFAAVLASVLMQAKDTELQDSLSFDRGIGKPNSLFIPKGTVGAGMSFSYSNYSIGNAIDDVGYKMLFSLIQGVKGNMLSFGVSPYVSYFFADNLSVGLMFDYDRSALHLDSVNMNIMEDMSLSVGNTSHMKQMYSGALTLRTYMPIAYSKRFAMFAEVQASGAYGQSETYRMAGEDKFGTYQDIYKFSLGVVPGITCFVTNEAAIEISVGVLGFDYQKVVQTTNQVDKSMMENSKANFKINLLSINFGMSFYILTGKRKAHKNSKTV